MMLSGLQSSGTQLGWTIQVGALTRLTVGASHLLGAQQLTGVHWFSLYALYVGFLKHGEWAARENVPREKSGRWDGGM